ncbi:hypothetical protein RRG08_006708 [Elysia crispata]|uniref:Uncharacterized protein n=1 Tax=Elysia crispata TaxID=231223 RepID=A0AAE1DAA8_9GAST|nr:hypothetical protein RRG08_006708 [Elysia crispata]
MERWGVILETMGQTLSQGGWKLWLVLSTWYLIDGERWGVHSRDYGSDTEPVWLEVVVGAEHLVPGRWRERWGVNFRDWRDQTLSQGG